MLFRSAFALAAKSGVPVVPVVITQREPCGIYALYKSKPLLTVRIGEPVRLLDHLDEKENCEYLMDTAYERMAEMLDGDGTDMETLSHPAKGVRI